MARHMIVSLVIVLMLVIAFVQTNAADTSLFWVSLSESFLENRLPVALGSMDADKNMAFEVGLVELAEVPLSSIIEGSPPHTHYTLCEARVTPTIGLDVMRTTAPKHWWVLYAGAGIYGYGERTLEQSGATGWYYSPGGTHIRLAFAYTVGLVVSPHPNVMIGVSHHSIRGSNLMVGYRLRLHQ